MGKFDKLEKKADYQSMERIGDSRQSSKLPMKNPQDIREVKRELDNASPDILLNRCKEEKDGRKHVLMVFYRNRSGRDEWIPVVMPRYRARKYPDNMKYIEVIDARNGRRKTFLRTSIRAVKKFMDSSTGKWRVHEGTVDKRRFRS